MTRPRRICIPGALTLLAMLIASTAGSGCADRRTAHLVPVTGVVRQAGRPVERGTVIFMPVPPLQAPLAFGDIGSDGRYTMRSANKYDGVAAGSYAVCIHLEDAAAAPPTDAAVAADPLLPRRPQPLLPSEYTSHAKTPLRREVSPGATTYDIDLPATPAK